MLSVGDFFFFFNHTLITVIALLPFSVSCPYSLHRLGLVLLVPHYLVELLFHASRLFYFSDENKQKGYGFCAEFRIYYFVGGNDLMPIFSFFFLCSFTLWALLFVIARLLTLTLSVLTFGFGLPRTENQGFSLAEGNFNVLTIR